MKRGCFFCALERASFSPFFGRTENGLWLSCHGGVLKLFFCNSVFFLVDTVGCAEPYSASPGRWHVAGGKNPAPQNAKIFECHRRHSTSHKHSLPQAQPQQTKGCMNKKSTVSIRKSTVTCVIGAGPGARRSEETGNWEKYQSTKVLGPHVGLRRPSSGSRWLKL